MDQNFIKYFEYLKKTTLENIREMEMKEIEKFNLMKIQEMLRFGKMILEELKQFKTLKMEGIDDLRFIELSKLKNFIDVKNFPFRNKENEIISLKSELENLKKKEIERLEKIKKEKIYLENIKFGHHNYMMDLSNCNPCRGLLQKNETKYNNDSNIFIIFEEIDFKYNGQNKRIIIKCSLNDKISLIIEKYKEKMGGSFQDKKFFFLNKELIPDLTVGQTNLVNNSIINVCNSSEEYVYKIDTLCNYLLNKLKNNK